MRRITESMDIYVKDFAPPDETYTLMDLCFYLSKQALFPQVEQWSPDEQHEFRSRRAGEIFAPDGDSPYNGPIGIINFYTSGITPQNIEGVLDEVKNKLHDVGVEVGPFKREAFTTGLPLTRVVRIPIIKNENDRDLDDLPPEIHRSNSNMTHLLRDILNFEGEDGDSQFTMSARELLMRTQMLMDAPSSELSMYRGSGYRDDIVSLNKAAQWAIDHGFDTLYAT